MKTPYRALVGCMWVWWIGRARWRGAVSTRRTTMNRMLIGINVGDVS